MSHTELTLLLLGALGLLVVLLALLSEAGFLHWLQPTGDKLREAGASIKRFCLASEVDNALRRMWPLWLLFVACFAVVLFLNPMKAGLAIYGIGKIALAGTVGYLISYCVTARAHRPESLADGIALGTALKCRTWIICACILAIAIGVP